MSAWQAGTMRARRGLTTIAIGGLAAGLLSGCVPRDGRTYPNAIDVTRAQRAWTNPWLAPVEASTVEPTAAAPWLRRDVARRGHDTPASPRAAVTTEVRAALASGWRLVEVRCQPDEQGSPGVASAELTLGSTVEDGIMASVSSSFGSMDATQYQGTQVVVSAEVAHHLDASWPERGPITLEGSCLLSDSLPAAPSPTPTPSSASPSPSPEWGEVPLPGEKAKAPEWQGDAFPDDLRDAMDALRDDPALRALGVTLRSHDGEREDSGVDDAVMSDEMPISPPTDLTRTVASLTSQGWTLTYAGCIGPGAPNLAELSRSAGKRTAVLRLSQVASSTADSPVEAKVVVSTPGYSPKTPAGISEPCFAASTPPTTFSHRGTPSLGPTRMLPLQR